MHGGGPAHQVQVAGVVHRQGFVDVAVGVDVGGHGAVQGQTAEAERVSPHPTH